MTFLHFFRQQLGQSGLTALVRKGMKNKEQKKVNFQVLNILALWAEKIAQDLKILASAYKKTTFY